MTGKPRRLDSLPPEMLAYIASQLDRSDLLSMRMCSNRAVLDGIDFVFKQDFFANRSFTITPSDIERFKVIADSRFGIHIRSISVELHMDVPMWLIESHRDLGILLSDRIDENERPEHGNAPESQSLSHRVFEQYWSPRTQFHSILTAVGNADLKLEKLELRGFTSQPFSLVRFAPTMSILCAISAMCTLRTITLLNLELDMFMQRNYLGTAKSLAHVLRDSPKLKTLALHMQPVQALGTPMLEREDFGRSLLQCLGSQPTFALRELCLKGLCAAGNMTLARVVEAHQSTLECLVLDNSYLNFPNRFPELILSLRKTSLKTLRFLDLILDRRYMLRSYYMKSQALEDDMLWKEGEDDSYKGWVEVELGRSRDRDNIEYDYRDDANGEASMQHVLSEFIVQIDCGAAGFD
ncbi:hypothetical protein EK21DRAFT_115798 [Setomelanomma holmii]|uniref:F-box domain-containing protein n=1 Tax=Setomelanomma holmii TaxID=210430 RepID=A0A9P4LIE1_9PLEO|nr:hypothetical protein EK21DRAFT_115798 [Setomelanomma holmii]